MVSVYRGFPPHRPPLSSENVEFFQLTKKAQEVLDAVPKRSQHIAFYFESNGPVKEFYGPWVQSGPGTYWGTLGPCLQPNAVGTLAIILNYAVPPPVGKGSNPLGDKKVPRALARRMADAVIDGMYDLTSGIVDGVYQSANPNVLGNYIDHGLAPTRELVGDVLGAFFGKDQGSYEDIPPPESPGTVHLLYVIGESVIPLDPPQGGSSVISDIAESLKDMGNNVERIAESSDRIQGLLTNLLAQTKNIADAQKKAGFYNMLGDVLNQFGHLLDGTVGGVGRTAGQWVKDLASEALSAGSEALVKAAMDALNEQFLGLWTKLGNSLSRDLADKFENKVDALYCDNKPVACILNSLVEAVNDSSNLGDTLDKYFMLPGHGGTEYNITDVCSVIHETVVIEEV